jgi:hypothetical protein
MIHCPPERARSANGANGPVVGPCGNDSALRPGTPPAPQRETKTVGGKQYVKVDGDWYEDD